MKQALKKLSVFILILPLFFTTGAFAQDYLNFPAKGRVTMIDLGAKKCIPCKMMAPILVKLEKAYKGTADIVFIDVWENKQPAQRFKIRAIPTQIFFNEQGEEVYRHVGFLDEKSIVEQMTKMGVKKPDLGGKG
ncbi:MAG: thioredoxin family protein [Desulfobacteraceae bacterium]|nr:thioredoxin family protein [Desulfobacteraceae bacterium]